MLESLAHPKNSRIWASVKTFARWVALDDVGCKFGACGDHVRKLMQVFRKGDGKPLLWVRARDKGSTPGERLMQASDDIEFSEGVKSD
jgi:hypothetical protein